MIGALPDGWLICFQIDTGHTADAGRGQVKIGEDRLNPRQHFGKGRVPVASDAKDKAGWTKHQDVFSGIEIGLIGYQNARRIISTEGHLPFLKGDSHAFRGQPDPAHGIIEHHRLIHQESFVDDTDGPRIFHPKPESCRQHIDGRFSVHIGCRSDDGHRAGHLGNLARQIVCPTQMPRNQADGESRPFIHHHDGRVLGFVDQKPGYEPYDNPASHDEDMAPVLLETAFHLNRELGEPDRLHGVHGVQSIPFDIKLLRQKNIA